MKSRSLSRAPESAPAFRNVPDAVAVADRSRPSPGSNVARHGGALDGARLLLAGLAIAGAIVAGMLIGSWIVMLVAASAAFLAGLVFPPLGLVVLAFMGPLRPPPAVPAPGFNMILAACVVLGCVYRLPLTETRPRASPALLLLFAFVGYVFVQQVPEMLTGYASVRSHDIGFLFFQLVTGLGAVVAAGFVLRGRSPYPVIAALLLSVVFAATLGIVTADGVPFARLENLLAPSDVGSRATGAFGNPNSFGQVLAYASVLAAALLVSTHSLRLRAGLLVALGVMALAVSLSLSRGATATLLAGLVALCFARGRAFGVAVSGIVIGLVIVAYPLFVEWRLAVEAGSASSAASALLETSDESRLAAVLAGPELFAMSPILGIGFGQYRYFSALVTDEGAGLVAHNWYGTVLAEQGIVGVVLWLLLLVAVALWLRERPARPRQVGFAMLGAVMVGSLFLAQPTSFQISILPAVVLTGALVADWGSAGWPQVRATQSPPVGAGLRRSAVVSRRRSR